MEVVDQQSATPVQWGEPIPLNANHIEMCKFENSSAEYDKVWSRIKDLAGRNCVIDARAYVVVSILFVETYMPAPCLSLDPTDAFYEAINASASERVSFYASAQDSSLMNLVVLLPRSSLATELNCPQRITKFMNDFSDGISVVLLYMYLSPINDCLSPIRNRVPASEMLGLSPQMVASPSSSIYVSHTMTL